MIAIIKQESKQVHPLARFVTVEAVALILNIDVARIKEIRLWNRMILVVAQGMSRFVSYADLPPILGVALPTKGDITTWRKLKQNHAPDFWFNFYDQKIRQSQSIGEVNSWEQLIALINFALSEKVAQALQGVSS